ncbi:uncharacterized protein Z519_03331 [Cladophialophora bantiana CBS 173.52]|uniref:Clr5 domain-containing protein n=1 Tax=Cladophialophora bantiana (strain ATCC 10958 / CBS 173.52 / CDC B-1940 / NIH 8579) TaxID=1442370 RepID=A0A0D2HS08_CLAB1|nr:uncharacterized protein Z519_03331 [Cladophialophora bantiana CBS 173.52]KIW96263.1 hypothetical protein Z519_03331 [Cladophialophora bantiana CBS 173.52]
MALTQSKESRKRAPSKVEWDRIHKHWHQLYIHEKLPLSEVSARLAREHNFEAGLSMCKTRMKQLQTRKNFKKQELAAVARILDILVQAGLKMPTAVIDGQSVPTERVKRHFSSLFAHNPLRSSKTLNSAPEKSYLHILNNFQDRIGEAKGGQPRRLPTMPRILLKQSEGMHDLELALIQFNNYYGWLLNQGDDYFLHQIANDGPDCTISSLWDPQEFFNAINDALSTFRVRAFDIAQAAIRNLHSRASVVLRQQHPSCPDFLLYFMVAYNDMTALLVERQGG